MKLIDADRVKGSFVKNEFYRGAEVMALLIQQSAAYDVDKVVERLEKRYMEMIDGKCKLSISDFFEYVIDVIKSGGID